MGLVGLLVLVIFYTFSLDARSKRIKEANRGALRAQGKSALKVAPSPVDNRIGMPRPRPDRLMVSGKWGPDPFNRGFAWERRGEPLGTAAAEEVPELKGILATPMGRSALIGDDVVSEGDTLGRYRVRSIGAGRVVLESLGGRSKIELRMD